MTNQCIMCGHGMEEYVENVPYRSLPGTILVGVKVFRCANCGEYEVEIPRPNELSKTLARRVIVKRSRLTEDELRFLRTFMNLEKKELGETQYAQEMADVAVAAPQAWSTEVERTDQQWQPRA